MLIFLNFTMHHKYIIFLFLYTFKKITNQHWSLRIDNTHINIVYNKKMSSPSESNIAINLSKKDIDKCILIYLQIILRSNVWLTHINKKKFIFMFSQLSLMEFLIYLYDVYILYEKLDESMMMARLLYLLAF